MLRPCAMTRARGLARRAAIATLAATLALANRAAASPDPILFRPMLADPHESAIHLQVASFTQDFRYGSDITDSLSHGGWQEGVSGVTFDLGGGKIFRGPVWRGLPGFSPPWKRYQLTASALATANLDRIQAQFVTVADYQFGGGIEIQWSGEGDEARGVTTFERPVLTTRTALVHRSSHVGDEYVGQSDFGRNQTGPGEGLGLSVHPPVKRTVLSYEALQQIASLEWSAGGGSTLRAYAGGEFKVGISGLKPHGFRSPIATMGTEFRSAGARADIAPDPLSRLVNRWLGRDALANSWFAAIHLTLARPFNFARSDNPYGDEEVWTPSLWTPSLYGREFRHYAASWHAMAGLALHDPNERNVNSGGRLTGPETVLTLNWYQGYSVHGPFLDSRRREHPRWYIVPGVTMHF